MEYEIKTEILVNNVSVPIFSKLDTATTDLSAFKEIKTGVTKWDQKKADNHGQITFYCVGILELTKKLPKDIELVYVPSKQNEDGTLELTGEIIKFKTTRSMADILKMKIRMKKAWERIGQLTEEYFL